MNPTHNQPTSNEARQTFSVQSGQYASVRPNYPAELFRWIAANSPHCDAAWDCATGTGQAAVGLAPYFARVYATDVSAEQLAHAPRQENVIYTVGPVENSDFPESMFDTITVAQALHWFDLPRFWSEVIRVSRPDALFCAWGYDWLRSTPEVNKHLVEPFRQIISPYWAKNNRLLWDGYRPEQLLFPFDLIEVPPFRIRAEWRLDHLIAYMQTWSAYKRSQKDFATTTAIQDLLTESIDLARPDDMLPIVMELKAIAGRVNCAGSRDSLP